MPNHVTNRLIFAAEHAEKIFAMCAPDGCFDFRTLIPQPLQMYRGNTTSEDEEDFKCNWSSWNRLNWGTKWNAYDGSCKVEDGKAIITFDTAWSVPYPVMSAFANKFGIPFEHRYFDEGHNFWGIETWETYGEDDIGQVYRSKKMKSLPEHKAMLCEELKGYNPDEEE